MARDQVGRFVELLRAELLDFFQEFYGIRDTNPYAENDVNATMRAMTRRIDKALQQLNDEQKGESHA